MKPVLPSINDIDFKQLNMNDMPMPDAELMDAFIRDLKNHESGNLVPETLGADYFFIRYFITEDMSRMQSDFPRRMNHTGIWLWGLY